MEDIQAVQLSLRQLGYLSDIIKNPTEKIYNSRKSTTMETRQAVWNFWNKAETTNESTLTYRPPKIRVENQPKIQMMLPFSATVTRIEQRGKEFFLGQWKITTKTVKDLWKKFNDENLEKVSYGVFHDSKPFYVRSATTKDITVCCCKLHLESRWLIEALVKICKKQDILLEEFNELLQN